jgi:anti-anti-sigma factor
MAFTVNTELTSAGIAKVTLIGELDASSAGVFRAEVEKLANQDTKRLVLLVRELSYIASAGIRVLVFAKQKMGGSVDIYVVAPQEQILETFEMTGLQNSVVIMKRYDAAKIEKL